VYEPVMDACGSILLSASFICASTFSISLSDSFIFVAFFFSNIKRFF
jgi:hypothetical protein